MPKAVVKPPVSSRVKISPKILINLLLKLKTTYVLGFLLIICAFLIGVMYTKISYLEKDTAAGGEAGINAGGSPAPAGYGLGEEVDLGKGSLPVLGKSDAKIKIVEFADYQCPFCERWHTEVEQNLIKDYVDSGKASFSFRHYAFLGQESTDAANAAECANEQGKFWEYHNYLYENQEGENQGAFAVANLKQFAADLGLDSEKFNTCLDTNKYNAEVEADMEAGQKAGVNGTPATFINGKMVQLGGNSAGALPYEEFKKLIDEALNN